MISNNTTYKLRAHKSSRDVQDYDFDNGENFEKASEEDESNRRNASFARESRYNKGVSRTRSTEFRPSRVSDRRSGYRGRASGSSSRRSDRDYADGYYGSRKSESRNADLLGEKQSRCFSKMLC